MGCLACLLLPLKKLPNVFHADFCFLSCGLCCLSSQLLGTAGNASSCVAPIMGAVCDRVQVGGCCLGVCCGLGVKIGESLSPVKGGRCATDVGGDFLVLLLTRAGEGNLKLSLPVTNCILGG